MVLELLFVLANLPVHLVDHEIDGLVHMLRRLDGLEDVAGATGDVHRELGDLHRLQALVLLCAELHARLQDVVEVPRQLLELGLCVGLHLGIGRGLLGLDQDLHGGLLRDLEMA